LATGFTTSPGSNNWFWLLWLEINPLLIEGYDLAEETVFMRILDQLKASVDMPLSVSRRQFMRCFSTVFRDVAELLKMPNNWCPWNVEFSGQSASDGCRIGADCFKRGFGIHSDRAIRVWFIFKTGVPVSESLEPVLSCAIWFDTFTLHFSYFLHRFCF
jgi:hypothetical protein